MPNTKADTALKVLLINPSSMPMVEQEAFLDKTSILRVPSFSMPMGLIDLAAYVREKTPGINITIVDIGKALYSQYLQNETRVPLSFTEFIDAELQSTGFTPDIIGVSVLFSSAHKSAMNIISLAKKRWPTAIVICGGNHATNYVKYLLENPDIDYVARGEAEITFTEFIHKFMRGDKHPTVTAFIDRTKLATSPLELSPMLEHLDDIPMPAYDLLDIETYRKTIGASIMFTRGCIYQCSFCATRTVHGSRVRYKSPERVLQEFTHLIKDLNFTNIVIEDDLFAAKKKMFLELVDKLQSLTMPIRFSLPQGLSVGILDEEIIDAMIRLGVKEAALAIESGSPYTQKNIIHKNVSLDKARKILEYFRKKDFLIYVNFILGFPNETRTLMDETIAFMKTLDVDWIYIFHALPLPGSLIYEQFIEMGVVTPGQFDWDGVRLGKRTFDTPEISASDLEALVYDTNIECNFFGNSNLKNGRYERAVTIFNRLILDLYQFHTCARYCRALAYKGLGMEDKAAEDLRLCVEWIGRNEESRRLYDRYKTDMPLLHDMVS